MQGFAPIGFLGPQYALKIGRILRAFAVNWPGGPRADLCVELSPLRSSRLSLFFYTTNSNRSVGGAPPTVSTLATQLAQRG